MKIYYDLHIHTALSPCGDRNMTPNNIVNMSILKGLDVIAITDHNSILNCKACMEAAQDKDIIVIPGMELQTKEEVHLICLFQTLDATQNFQNVINKLIINKDNNPEYFGRQLILDKDDNIIDEEKRLLMASVDISINKAVNLVKELEGVVIPAHINKKAFSIISNLGFIPPGLDILYVENYGRLSTKDLLAQFKYLKKYNIIKNSDAHYLGDISEGKNYLEVKEKSIEAVFNCLRANKKM